MWRSWKGDLAALLIGLALAPVAAYAVGGAIVVYKAATCDEQCEMEGGWRLYPGM